MSELPLHGIRVLDLSWIIAGPTATRFLASMGAEVIKIGSARRPDPSTRGPAFQAYNQSKLYASLNISTPEGLALVKRLIAVSDVVIENFAAGVIERLGLGYDVVRAARPDIIMLASSGTGIPVRTKTMWPTAACFSTIPAGTPSPGIQTGSR